MSRTRRKLDASVLDNVKRPWQVFKHTVHAGVTGSMAHRKVGRMSLGPGGINCMCCTRMPPTELKVKVRRAERHTDNIKVKEIIIDA